MWKLLVDVVGLLSVVPLKQMIFPEDIQASLEVVNGRCHHYFVKKFVPHSCDTDGVEVVADVVASFCPSDFDTATVTPRSRSGLHRGSAGPRVAGQEMHLRCISRTGFCRL